MSTAQRLVDRRAVSAGAGLALGIALPTIVAVQIVDATVGINADSNLVFIPYLIVVAALVAGGWRAGRRRVEAPLTHGALAALTAYLLVAGGVTVARFIGDKAGETDDLIFNLVFNGLVATSAGLLGGLLATRRRVQ